MIDFWLKYPADTWREGSLMLAANWPIALAAAAVLGGTLLIVVGLWRRQHPLSPLQRGAIAALQVTMLVFVVILLWQPSLSIDRVTPGTNTLAILVDDSASMGFVDNGQRRIDQVRELVESADVSGLSDHFTIELFRFSDNALAVSDLSQLRAVDDASALQSSLQQLMRRSASNALGAVLVFSDGQDTAPVSGALADLSSWQIPVHTVGIGREQVPEDVGIAEVQLPPSLSPGSQLRARITLVHGGPGLARLTVSQSGQLMAVEEIPLGAGNRTSTWLDLPLPDTGYHELTFALEPSATDSNLANNTLTRMLEVAPRARRVLYVEGEPRWEYKFLRRALRDDPSIELVTLLRVSPNKYYRQGISDAAELEAGFPTDRETLFQYHGIIIGSIEAASFTDDQLNLISDFVAERGGGLLMLAGRSGLGQGGWGNSLLAGALPTELPPAQRESFARQRWPVQRTAQGEQSSVLRLSNAPGGDNTLWQTLPELADYQELGALKPAATQLLSVQVNGAAQPLMVRQPYGRGRTIALATSGTWRWQMSLPVEDQRHETFWRQLLRSLTSEARDAFELDVSTEGSTLNLRAEVRDEAFQPRATGTVSATISGTTVSQVTLSPVVGEAGVFAAQIPLAGDGAHFVEAGPGPDAASSDEPAARAALFHAGKRLERVSLAQNRPGLMAISNATGGRYFAPDELGELAQTITSTSAGITETQILPVWDAPLLLLVLVLLKTAEWLLRRRWTVI